MDNEITTGSAMVFASLLVIPLFLSYQGVEFDFLNKKVRRYKYISYFIKVGRWTSFSKFNNLEIEREKYSYRNYSATMSVHRIHYCYNVLLQNKDISIVLGEFEEHSDANDFAFSYGNKMGLPVVDQVREKQSKTARRKVRRVRRR